MNVTGLLRSSEFWVAVAVGLGQLGATVGLWSQEDFTNVLLPSIVYIISRIIGKVAKATVPPTAVLLALLFVAPSAYAQDAPKVFGASVGLNGIWTHGATGLKDVEDIEAGLHVRASLSPHISAVGSLGRGFVNEYNLAQGGVRITVSDVQDRSMSVGVGIQYRWISEEAYGVREWRPDVVIGWRPPGFPAKVIVGAGGSYGLTSQTGQGTLALRYVAY